MRDFYSLYSLPNLPAVYTFHSGSKGQSYIVYVGIAGKLKQRISVFLGTF
jgi:excinuclease UvrABC nuclease subunit